MNQSPHPGNRSASSTATDVEALEVLEALEAAEVAMGFTLCLLRVLTWDRADPDDVERLRPMLLTTANELIDAGVKAASAA